MSLRKNCPECGVYMASTKGKKITFSCSHCGYGKAKAKRKSK